MTKRFVPMLFLLAACSSGASDESPSSFSASFTGNTTAEAEGDGDDDTTDDPSGEEDPDDDDGEPTTDEGDGDGEPTTDEGDGDGDGDEDPCPLICDGKPDSTPVSCDAPYFIGRTKAKAGFFYGGSTQASMNSDTERCGPKEDPANWDSGNDHFFRIFLVQGDKLSVVQNPNGWDARLKIHDEAECIGNAKECSTEADPAEILDYKAPKTDWFTIVADGQSAGFQDWGDYTLTVELEEGPGVDQCGCP